MKVYDADELALFDHYDPFNDPLPDDVHWDVAHIVQRATLILQNRTLDQLKSALLTLHRWRGFAVSNPLPVLTGIYGDQEEISFSDVQMMYFSRDDFRDSPIAKSQDELNDAERFATYALGRISAILGADRDDADDSQAIRSTLIEATEALGFAEALWIEELRNEKRRRTVSAQRRKQYGPIKRWLVQAYSGLPHGISNQSAARDLNQRLPDELRYRFATEDVEQQLALWIGQYKNGRLTDVDDLPPFHSNQETP